MVFGRNRLFSTKFVDIICLGFPQMSDWGAPKSIGVPPKGPPNSIGGIGVIILEANILGARLGGRQTIGGPPKGPPNADWGAPKPEIGPPNLIGGPAKYKGFPQNDWGAPK